MHSNEALNSDMSRIKSRIQKAVSLPEPTHTKLPEKQTSLFYLFDKVKYPRKFEFSSLVLEFSRSFQLPHGKERQIQDIAMALECLNIGYFLHCCISGIQERFSLHFRFARRKNSPAKLSDEESPEPPFSQEANSRGRLLPRPSVSCQH